MEAPCRHQIEDERSLAKAWQEVYWLICPTCKAIWGLRLIPTPTGPAISWHIHTTPTPG